MEKTKEIKLSIIENFIDHFTTDEWERELMKDEASLYVEEDHVEEDHVDEIKQSQPKERDYHVITSNHAEGLTSMVKKWMKNGWKPLGGHSVVETHRQNRYAGTQHMDTIIKVEYSQTMVRE